MLGVTRQESCRSQAVHSSECESIHLSDCGEIQVWLVLLIEEHVVNCRHCTQAWAFIHLAQLDELTVDLHISIIHVDDVIEVDSALSIVSYAVELIAHNFSWGAQWTD